MELVPVPQRWPGCPMFCFIQRLEEAERAVTQSSCYPPHGRFHKLAGSRHFNECIT